MLSKIIWSRCTKEVWESLKAFEQAAYLAVAHFNDRNIIVLKIFEKLGICPGHLTSAMCQKLDKVRLDKESRRSSDASKRRKTSKAI